MKSYLEREAVRVSATALTRHFRQTHCPAGQSRFGETGGISKHQHAAAFAIDPHWSGPPHSAQAVLAGSQAEDELTVDMEGGFSVVISANAMATAAKVQ